jgi:hypothetical protein
MNCKNCKHWTRSHNWYVDDNLENKEVALKIGECEQVINGVGYWYSADKCAEIIQEGKIGADNLYTHENFGCIHFELKKV